MSLDECVEGIYPLICFDIVKTHLLECILPHYGLVRGIPSASTQISRSITSPRRGIYPTIRVTSMFNIAHWDHVLERPFIVPINAANASTTSNYLQQWMTPQCVIGKYYFIFNKLIDLLIMLSIGSCFRHSNYIYLSLQSEAVEQRHCSSHPPGFKFSKIHF